MEMLLVEKYRKEAETLRTQLAACEKSLKTATDSWNFEAKKCNEAESQLAKANEEYKNLFEIFESCQARMLRYKSAIDEECVLWDFTVDEKDPRKSIQRLLDITDAVARDPDVNSKAMKFAIENKAEALSAVKNEIKTVGGLEICDVTEFIDEQLEQLRKERDSE